MKKLLLIFFYSAWTFYGRSQNLPRVMVLSTAALSPGNNPMLTGPDIYRGKFL